MKLDDRVKFRQVELQMGDEEVHIVACPGLGRRSIIPVGWPLCGESFVIRLRAVSRVTFNKYACKRCVSAYSRLGL